MQQRNETVGQIVRHMTENLNVLPLFHDSEPVMINARVVNAGGRRGMALRAGNAHEWDRK